MLALLVTVLALVAVKVYLGASVEATTVTSASVPVMDLSITQVVDLRPNSSVLVPGLVSQVVARMEPVVSLYSLILSAVRLVLSTETPKIMASLRVEKMMSR